MWLPFGLVVVIGAPWLFSEFKGRRALRIVLGILTAVSTFMLASMMGEMSLRYANTETRGCVSALRRALETEDVKGVSRCLNAYWERTSKGTGNSEARYKMMKELEDLSTVNKK